eukprot:sb/3466301/
MRKKLIVGNVCKDIIYYCATYPREDSKVKATNRTIRLGGNAGNILQVMPQLPNDFPNGEGVCGYVKLGSCSYSQEVAEFLRGKLGNGTLYTSVQEGASLPESVLITSEGTGSRTCLHYRGDCEDLTLAEFQRDIDPGQFGWIHFEFRRNSEEVVKMIKFVREVNPAAQISLEVEKVRGHMDEALGLVNWAIVSKEVSRDLGCETLDAALEFLAPKLECWNYRNGLIVTWGDQGAGFVERGMKGLCPVEKIPDAEIVDSIGAGDTFTAVFISMIVESEIFWCFDAIMNRSAFSQGENCDLHHQLAFLREELTETSKQPIRTCYLGHVTGYQPISDHYFLIRLAPVAL